MIGIIGIIGMVVMLFGELWGEVFFFSFIICGVGCGNVGVMGLGLYEMIGGMVVLCCDFR